MCEAARMLDNMFVTRRSAASLSLSLLLIEFKMADRGAGRCARSRAIPSPFSLSLFFLVNRARERAK